MQTQITDLWEYTRVSLQYVSSHCNRGLTKLGSLKGLREPYFSEGTIAAPTDADKYKAQGMCRDVNVSAQVGNRLPVSSFQG